MEPAQTNQPCGPRPEIPCWETIPFLRPERLGCPRGQSPPGAPQIHLLVPPLLQVSIEMSAPSHTCGQRSRTGHSRGRSHSSPRAVSSQGGLPGPRVRPVLPSEPQPKPRPKVVLCLHPWPPGEERARPEGRALAFLFGRVTPTLFLLAHSRCSLRHAEITDDGGHPGGARAAGAPSERPQTPRRPRLTSVPSPPAATALNPEVVFEKGLPGPSIMHATHLKGQDLISRLKIGSSNHINHLGFRLSVR